MFEYKIIPVPARLSRQRGLKTVEERFAHTLSELLNRLAAEGWEFLRAESVEVDLALGWFRRKRRVRQSVLIFRRQRQGGAARRDETAENSRAAVAEPPGTPRSTPTPADKNGFDRRAEPIFRPGALRRAVIDPPVPPLRPAPTAAVHPSAADPPASTETPNKRP